MTEIIEERETLTVPFEAVDEGSHITPIIMDASLNHVRSVTKTKDGYLKVTAPIARSGIQQYTKAEVGLIGDGLVNVYRPEGEVFDKQSAQTFAGKPVTINHPPELVTADNWSKYAVGSVQNDITREQGHIIANMLIYSSEAADLMTSDDDEYKQFSAGYRLKLAKEDGVTSDGVRYQFKQTGIDINHVAIVSRARAGNQATIKQDTDMTERNFRARDMHTYHFGDGEYTVDAQSKPAFDALIAKKDAEINALNKKLDEAKAEAASMKSKLEEEEEKRKEAEAKSSDEAIEKLAADRAELTANAKAFGVASDGKSSDVMKRVVGAKLGDDFLDSDATDSDIKAAYKLAVKSATKADANDDLVINVDGSDDFFAAISKAVDARYEASSKA